MSVLDTNPKDPPHFFCPSMTVTEDRILRELHRNSGVMSSETLRASFVLTESVDNIYGGLGCLREMGYVETEIIDWNDWQHHYRPLRVTLTPRGRTHVLRTDPITTDWRGVFLWIALAGAAVSAAQSVVTEPDFGPVGVSMLCTGVILLLARRAGKILMRKQR